ncbi:N-terminal binuclear Zn cluster-containing DNA binding domain-containing [Fusarium albosuccineum]|uniref:N-terminal binuclear Zn cluster-containing DNA binding domain-containing n=1 Tax=Fusarium albosuccineum TaxID=1237068 RepID=A0A8H4KWG5_9HYPO|nr:N-terminal binuclear Zn cluster-containing DNA binding domain-containing [Fusarium albosuccineum]
MSAQQNISPDASAPAPVQKRRRRPALACEQCRRRKVRCDRLLPCNHCSKSVDPEQCTYVPVHVPKQKKKQQAVPAATTHTVSIRPAIAIAPTPANSHCSTENTHPILRSSSASGPIFESGDTASTRWTESIQFLDEELEHQPESSVGEGNAEDEGEGPSTSDDVSRTRYFGRSHWMTGLGLLPIELDCIINPKSTKGELYTILGQCKTLGRRIKESRLQPISSNSLGTSINIPRATANCLLDLYISNLEPVFPILHIPSFRTEYERYWQEPILTPTVFRIQLQLVLALGACLLDDRFSYRSEATRWIYEAQLWAMLPPEKSRMTIAGIQTLTLLTLARSVCSTGHDSVWVSTGTLLRTAMFMGLHRDPSKLRKAGMSVFRSEMRRRLWFTILEFNLQSAFDASAAPGLAADDYDTLLPANLNDEELGSEKDGPLQDGRRNEGDGKKTRMSVAIALAKSIPLRLSLLQHANDFRGRQTYDETLRLNSELVQTCRTLSNTLEGLLRSQDGVEVTRFHASLVELMAYRCFHALHQPVILHSLSDPKYYFSQKMYIDGALKIAQVSGFVDKQGIKGNRASTGTSTAAVATSNGRITAGLELPMTIDPLLYGALGSTAHQKSSPEVLFQRLLTNGGGMFRNVPLHAVLGIILELASKWGDKAAVETNQLPGVHSTRDNDFTRLSSILVAAQVWTLSRIRAGETHIKSHYFLSCYLKHMFAIKDGADKAGLEESVATGAIETAKRCREELIAVAEAQGLSSEISEHGESIWDSPLPRQNDMTDSDLNVPDFDFTNTGVEAMGMDWMGDWAVDDMAEFANFSWGMDMNTTYRAPYM